MKLTAEALKKLLVTPGYIDAAVFDTVATGATAIGIDIEKELVNKGLISDEHLGQAVANAYDWRFINLSKMPITDDLLVFIPEQVARSQRAIVFDKTDQLLKVASSDPDNYEFLKMLEKTSGLEVEIYYATPSSVDEAIRSYRRDLEVRVKEILTNFKNKKRSEESVVDFVNTILEFAHDNHSSDIHFEPLEKTVAIRLRVDGVLHQVLEYPKALHEQVVFRLKIMSRLKTDEHQAAQDGRFDYNMNDIRFDVRLSILPVTDGENLVLRLLTESGKRLVLEDLGFIKEDLAKVKRAADKPYGMILSVGPTGSGKTTTLYALLQELNTSDVNIMTIEDPVEYQMPHVQQTQVNSKKNLTFATGLRSLVRQDPDIIMVGEIRDTETANIAVNIAMTGHLLLSTLHANDSATTFPRLIDMGVEPFLVASSVNVVVAQRLVRKTCDRCRVSYHLDKHDLEWINAEANLLKAIKKMAGKETLAKLTLYKGAGCKFCGNTGYVGRTGIFEVMEIEDTLRALINKKAPADEIYHRAIEIGMRTMLDDGIAKALTGLTTLDEIMRSTRS